MVGRVAQQLDLPRVQNRVDITATWAPNAFNKYFLNQGKCHYWASQMMLVIKR